MIRVEERECFGQVITAVLDVDKKPPRIINIREGTVSAHAHKVADYHAGMQRQQRYIVLDPTGSIHDSVQVLHQPPEET